MGRRARLDSVSTAPSTTAPNAAADALARRGHVRLAQHFARPRDAWVAALAVLEQVALRDPLCQQMPPLTEVGRFTIPPHGALRRDFQSLHIDFGLPLGSQPGIDVARYTALYVEPTLDASGAQTRLVPLDQLFAQRRWPADHRVVEALRQRYGGDGAEGILARIVEAVDQTDELPDKGSEAFLCGMEFATLDHEEQFFAAHDAPLAAVEVRVRLAPGEVLLFDNLAVAHGRAGLRQTRELHQLCLGFPQARPEDQDRVLTHFLSQMPAPTSAP
jgi:hypothetical protein